MYGETTPYFTKYIYIYRYIYTCYIYIYVYMFGNGLNKYLS